MEQLSTLAKKLYEEQNEELFSDFIKILDAIILDINYLQYP